MFLRCDNINIFNNNFLDILISTPLRLVHAIQHESIKLDG